MPQSNGDAIDPTAAATAKSSKPTYPPPSPPRSWLTTPAPIKRLFSYFPLRTLPANPLPIQNTSPRSRTKHTFYSFTAPSDTSSNVPSFNPSCLKWQTYLLFWGVEFTTVPSNNHASPSGALPFVIPSSPSTSTAETSNTPIPSSKLGNWAPEKAEARPGTKRKNENESESEKMRTDAYLSLIDHAIREAWLYNLYQTPNFTSIINPLYIQSSTTFTPVQISLSYSLKSAARLELSKFLPNHPISPGEIYSGAQEAFSALSTLLGSDTWFFGKEEPGLLDAAVFAYTHLILDEELGNGWADTELKRILVEFGNLVRHRRRVYRGYYV